MTNVRTPIEGCDAGSRARARRTRGVVTLALCAVAACSFPGCRSITPKESDSTGTKIAKVVVCIPLIAGLIVADAFVEDETGLPLFGDDCGDDGGDGGDDCNDDEAARASLRRQAELDFRRPGWTGPADATPGGLVRD